MGLTSHFQLQKLNSGDSFATAGQKYTTTDRDIIDRLLYLGAQGHVHDGQVAVNHDPTIPATLLVDTTQGYLPSSTRVTYAYTYVDPTGAETAPSPAVFVDLPGQIVAPLTPTAVLQVDSGTLLPGGYYYAITVYTGASDTSETAASPFTYITVPAVGGVDIVFPTVPSGAAGFNVYRKGPGETNLVYLASVSLPALSFLDDGSAVANPNRSVPSNNSTQSTNTITLTIPQAPPVGWTWNLYRTIVIGQWINSFLASVVNLDGTGNLVLSYVDVGMTTAVGAPPVSSQLIGSPSKIDLSTDVQGQLDLATGVQGVLPASALPATTVDYPVTVTFSFPGPVVPQSGKSVWVCDFPYGQLLFARAALGPGSIPTSSVTVSVLQGSGSTPTYGDVMTTSVDAGTQIGSLMSAPPNTIAQTDSFTVDITAGDATATDLTVTLMFLVSGSVLPQLGSGGSPT